jgi:Family of unknown function (DUF5678)
MLQIALQINDEKKAHLLVEMLSAMNFVEILDVTKVNGSNNDDDDPTSIFYHDPRQVLMLQEEAAFKEMHSQLVEHYLGKYVAMYQGKVVANDTDELQVVEQVRAKYPDKVVLIRKVQKELPRVLVFRSPRLVPAL